MSEALTVAEHIIPALRACELSNYYGQTVLTWEDGRVVDVVFHQRMRLPGQIRAFMKGLVSVKKST